MSKKELTKKRICFVLYGYKIDVLTLFDKLLPFYEEKNYPLKSVRYDFLKDKSYRDEKLSILKFQEKRKKSDFYFFYGKTSLCFFYFCLKSLIISVYQETIFLPKIYDYAKTPCHC